MKILEKDSKAVLLGKVKTWLRQDLFLTIEQKKTLFEAVDSYSKDKLLKLYQELFFSNKKKDELVSDAFKSDKGLSDKIENFVETETDKKELRTNIVRSQNKTK